MKHWMFNCKQVARLVSESLDRRLPIYQRVLIRMHLLMCRHCHMFAKHLQIIRRACRARKVIAPEQTPPAKLSAEARQRMKSALQAHRVEP